MEIREEVFSGFCKSMNETRTVFCEFEVKDGGWQLSDADCAFGVCVHSKDCLLMAKAQEFLLTAKLPQE